MKKRMLSALIALSLSLGLSVAPARAALPEGGEYGVYVEYGSAAQYNSEYTPAYLTGANLKLYEWLKENFAKVADGAVDSTELTFDASGLGISYSGNATQGVNARAVVNALLLNCPYEVYWFNKSTGWKMSSSYNPATREVTSITFQFTVYQDYAKTVPGENKYYTYRPDPAKTRAASAVLQNARAVVEQYKGLSDYDKLAAYRDYICGQVEYNQAAADSSRYPYGYPWQLIPVFDNDPATNVVCEGYSKAFKYLCDISTFSNQVECYLVSGTTGGPHMWNIVRINGQSYLADLTACDSGPQQREGLFLAGSSDSTANGCTIKMDRYDLPGGRYYAARTEGYRYDDDTKSVYGSDVLTLAPSGYNPSAQAPSAPAFTDVPGWCADAVNWAVDQNITAGMGDNKFAPSSECTNAQILTFLWRAAGRLKSNAALPMDITGKNVDWAADALRWAAGKGIIDGTLDPTAPCTRLSAVTYIWAVSTDGYYAAGASFSDLDGVGAIGRSAVAWAVQNGITAGTGDNTFSPDKVCNRGEIVTFLHRAYVPSARLK